ncbi:nuclear transport factor 2 family protein [Tritonibacter mobilis]|nr:nuclear transport factor 2 family protein [Tritonibacter mobilis]
MTFFTVAEYQSSSLTAWAQKMTREIIESFWEAMATNDFAKAALWLHPDFEYFMPQTCEYLTGRENFARFNAAYPTEGKWTFSIQSIVFADHDAVSDVLISDGSMHARAITFHKLRDGLIVRQKEFWPDNYPAPQWRSPWMKVVGDAPF